MAILQKEVQGNLDAAPIYNVIAESLEDLTDDCAFYTAGTVALILSDPLHIYILNSQKEWVILL